VSPDGRELAFNDFTPNGFRIAVMPNDTAAWTPLAQLPNQTVSYFRPLMLQEGEKNLLRMAGNEPYAVRPYRRAANLLNPYSWGPVLSSTGSELFVGLSSQDLLSTLALETGLGFDANQRTASYLANVSYQGWYPVIDVSVSSGNRRGTGYIDRRQPLDRDSLRTDTWRETSVTAGLRLPFNFTRSRFRESLSLSAYGGLTQVSGYDFRRWFASELSNGTLYEARYRLQYNRLHKQALRDVFPRWGQTLLAQYRHTLPGGDFTGSQFAVQAGLFVPGIGKHHGLLLRGGYKYEDVGATSRSYRFAAPLLFVRGYGYASSEQYVGASADYRLPIFNPDWAVGRWVYLQRFKANVFADYGYLATGNRTDYLTSAGVDVSVEFNFMRLLPRLELGVRTVYLPQENRTVFQPLVVDVGF
ncbi:MAG: hypothetical protein MUD08_17540, partial [Cytophagales bacterium]|nr:hypothetical protein [Cytophagales bacterium]